MPLFVFSSDCILAPVLPATSLMESGIVFAIRIISNKQMNVIRCDCIVENYQTISLPCFKKPS